MITNLNDFLDFLEETLIFYSYGEEKWNDEEFNNISRDEIINQFIKWKLDNGRNEEA